MLEAARFLQNGTSTSCKCEQSAQRSAKTASHTGDARWGMTIHLRSGVRRHSRLDAATQLAGVMKKRRLVGRNLNALAFRITFPCFARNACKSKRCQSDGSSA